MHYIELVDSHYDIVMKEIEDSTEKGIRLYFAYSGVLDIAAFDVWKNEHNYPFFSLPPGKLAVAKNHDLVFDFPSRWWGGRVASLEKKTGAGVYGKLFEIPAKHWPVIQHKEGVVTGMSVEIPITVVVEGNTVEATSFVTNPTRVSLEGPISTRYLEALTRGARQSGLPESYIISLTQKAL